MNEAIKPEEQPNTPKPKQKKYTSSLTILAIISVAALALSIFVWFFYYKNIKQQNLIIETLEAQLQNETQTLAESIQTLSAHHAAEQETLASQIKLLEKNQKQHWAQLHSDEIWRLYEAQYLIDTAYWKLTINHDVKTAIALLKNAEQQIQPLNIPSATSLKKVLMKNKAELEAIPSVDLNAIISKLNGLLEKLYSLPKHTPGSAQSTSTTQNKSTPPESTSSALWNSMKEQFHEIVHIRRNDETFQPLLSELEQTQLMQSLALQIQQAQFAAVHYDETLYKHSLEQFKSLLTRFFKTENNDVTSLIEQTDELLAITITPSLPNLSDALEAVQLAIKQEIDKAHSVRGTDA